jgi:hypothetical protein
MEKACVRLSRPLGPGARSTWNGNGERPRRNTPRRLPLDCASDQRKPIKHPRCSLQLASALNSLIQIAADFRSPYCSSIRSLHGVLERREKILRGRLDEVRLYEVDSIKIIDRFSERSFTKVVWKRKTGDAKISVARNELKVLVPARRFELLTPRV